MLLQYFMLVVFVFILEVISAVLIFIYQSDLEYLLNRELLNGIRTEYPANDEPDDKGLRGAWNHIQSQVVNSDDVLQSSDDLLLSHYKKVIAAMLSLFYW